MISPDEVEEYFMTWDPEELLILYIIYKNIANSDENIAKEVIEFYSYCKDCDRKSNRIRIGKIQEEDQDE